MPSNKVMFLVNDKKYLLKSRKKQQY